VPSEELHSPVSLERARASAAKDGPVSPASLERARARTAPNSPAAQSSSAQLSRDRINTDNRDRSTGSSGTLAHSELRNDSAMEIDEDSTELPDLPAAASYTSPLSRHETRQSTSGMRRTYLNMEGSHHPDEQPRRKKKKTANTPSAHPLHIDDSSPVLAAYFTGRVSVSIPSSPSVPVDMFRQLHRSPPSRPPSATPRRVHAATWPNHLAHRYSAPLH
jgi:hypothetical protein